MGGNICFEAQDNLKRYKGLKGKQRREAESLPEADRKVRGFYTVGSLKIFSAGEKNSVKCVFKFTLLISSRAGTVI